MNFTLSKSQIRQLKRWRKNIEKETGKPVRGIQLSFTYLDDMGYQIIAKLASHNDLRLKGIPRENGTYDHFDDYEDNIEGYDNLGFSSSLVKFPKYEMELYALHDAYYEIYEEQVFCYIRLLNQKNRLMPVTVSKNPTIVTESPYIQLFGKPKISKEQWKVASGFIRQNLQPLCEHWNGKISTCEFYKSTTGIEEWGIGVSRPNV